MGKPRPSTAVDCPDCHKTIGRKADLARHMKLHAPDKESLKIPCPYVGCDFKTFQRSNLQHHLNIHTGERPYGCPEDGCDFSTSDPGSLTRHRVSRHGYNPKDKSNSCRPASARKAARRGRRVSPYGTSSLTSPSGSASLPPSPRPQLPQLLDQSPPSSIPLTNPQGSKNASAAYSTELITKLLQANGSVPASVPESENSPSGLLLGQEATAEDHSQPPEAERPYAVEPEASDVLFDQFMSQFHEWNTTAPTVHDPLSIPTPVAQPPVHDVFLPTAASFPMPMVQQTVYDPFLPTTTPIPIPVVQPTVSGYNALLPTLLPSYGDQYTVANTTVPAPISLPIFNVPHTTNNPPFQLNGYPGAEALFDGQVTQPGLFAVPDVGFYPYAVDQTFYTTPAGFYPY